MLSVIILAAWVLSTFHDWHSFGHIAQGPTSIFVCENRLFIKCWHPEKSYDEQSPPEEVREPQGWFTFKYEPHPEDWDTYIQVPLLLPFVIVTALTAFLWLYDLGKINPLTPVGRTPADR